MRDSPSYETCGVRDVTITALLEIFLIAYPSKRANGTNLKFVETL